MANNGYVSDDDDTGMDWVQLEVEFIGRTYDLEKLNKEWGSHKIFGIFGTRSVGKSRLIREFLDRRQKAIGLQECQGIPNGASSRPIRYTYVDMRTIHTVSSLHANICASFGVIPVQNPTLDSKWIRQTVEEISGQSPDQCVIFLDNAEHAIDGPMKYDFLSLLVNIVRRCDNAKVFVTSTTKIQFSQIRKVYLMHEVLPLPLSEASTLVKAAAPGVDLGHHEAAIVTLSEGLPLLILMIGAELTDGGGAISPKQMVEILSTCRLQALSREFYPEEDRVADVYKKFIERLSTVNQTRLKTLEYIPGSFDTYEAKEILGHDTEAQTMDQTLLPIRHRHFLTYDPTNRRFNIQGILRECLQVYYTIRDLPDVQRRYYETFSKLMQTISQRIGTGAFASALSQFSLEQPNLQKLLKEVMYSKEDTYQFFIQVAEGCTTLIESFMAEESTTFYDGCLRLTSMYGTDSDKAIVHIAKGSLLTNVKGEPCGGEEHYRHALDILMIDGGALQLATVYQRLGWSMHVQGKSSDAIPFLTRSLDITQLRTRKEFQQLALQSMATLGLVYTKLGVYDEGYRYHIQVLERRRASLGNTHPFVGSILNNLGIFYDLQGEPEKAIEYFNESLQIKRKSNASSLTLVPSLNNIAAQKRKLNDFEHAHTYLNEAMIILKGLKVPPHLQFAITYDSLGMLYGAEGQHHTATKMFEKAVGIRKLHVAKSSIYVESLTHLACSYKCEGNYTDSEITALQALRLKDQALDVMPHNPIISECLECLADVYNAVGKAADYQNALKELLVELSRLERLYESNCNERKLHSIQHRLATVRTALRTISVEGSGV